MKFSHIFTVKGKIFHLRIHSIDEQKNFLSEAQPSVHYALLSEGAVSKYNHFARLMVSISGNMLCLFIIHSQEKSPPSERMEQNRV